MDASTINSDKRLVVIQRNPRSGSGAGRKELLVLVRYLRSAGFHVRMFRSRPKLDAFLSAPEKYQNLRCIVAAGGDGTVADVVNRHHGCPIAILPLGTENLLAKYLKLTRCGQRLGVLIEEGRTRQFDSATANGHRFLLMFSVGVDGDIVHAIHSSRTGNISRLRYVWPTFHAFLTSPMWPVGVTDTERQKSIEGTHAIVTNIPRYGFGLKFAPESSPDDGLLNVRVYHGKTRWQICWHAIRLKLGLPIRASEITKFTARKVRIDSPQGTAVRGVQADGDPCTPLPVEIVVQPATLCVVVGAE